MTIYQVICQLMLKGVPFSIVFDGVDGNCQINVGGNHGREFTSEDFHHAAQWMFDAAFKKGNVR